MKEPSILVTGIGGNVGQGILRNLRLPGLPLRLLGSDINGFCAGSYFCDRTFKLPLGDDPEYLPAIESLCCREEISLIIPSTDLECAVLADWGAERTDAPTVLSSPRSACKIAFDKWLTFEACQQHGLPFAFSCLPSTLADRSGAGWIAKPRRGRGSRGLILEPSDPGSLDDQDYLLQTFHRGMEITTAAYVTRAGVLHSHLTMKRDLLHGMTNRCEVINDFNSTIGSICEAYAQKLGLRGPFNLQSIVTAEGAIFPFEINCRYSGTNSIRSQFGFTDVLWGVEEYLLQKAPSPAPSAYAGAALRVALDIVYPGLSLHTAAQNPSSARIF